MPVVVLVCVIILVCVVVLVCVIILVCMIILVRVSISGRGLDGVDGVSKGDEGRRILCSVLHELFQP